MKQEFMREIDGYDAIVKEIEVSRKYGVDYTLFKGKVAEYVERYHPARLRLRVNEIIQETSTTKVFRLVSPERPLPPFLAGQYVTLFFTFGAVHTSRAYSISSPPHHGGYYDLTVRQVPDGMVTAHLHERVNVGDWLESSAPSGNFYHHPLFHDKVMVCLAGGSGIVPFMSMIREVAQRGLEREIILFYGNRDAGDVIFHRELTEIASRCHNIHYRPVLEQDSAALEPEWPFHKGLITGVLLQEALGDVSGKTFYLCGPSAMYDYCGAQLEALGVPRRKIRRESYGVPRSISQCAGWPEQVREESVFQVTVNGSRTIPARAGEPLLNALEKGGYIVPSSCRSGECSLCRVKLLSGRVYQPEGVLLRVSDQRFGYIHSCAAYPLEDLSVTL